MHTEYTENRQTPECIYTEWRAGRTDKDKTISPGLIVMKAFKLMAEFEDTNKGYELKIL